MHAWIFRTGSGRGCFITPLAVPGREAGEGLSEVKCLPGLANSGLHTMRDVPGHTAHLLTSRLSEALKLAACVGVFAVVDKAALFNKQTAPVLRGQAPSALGRTNDISGYLEECLLARPDTGTGTGTGTGARYKVKVQGTRYR